MFLMFLFTLSICSYIPVVKTFNLDIISPTLRTGPPKSLFGFAVVSSSTKQHWTYVGAPRAFLTRQSSSVVALNSTEIIPNGRIFGNIFECPNGTDECRPILLENQLSEAMPSFHNVLDDAWLGSSLIATSDDSLVTCGYRLMRNISIDRYDTRGGCYKVSSDHQDVSYYDFCEQNSETELLHEGSALCQSGLSLAYIPSGGRSDIIAFGEPGAFQWSGRIEADYSDTVLRQLYAYKSASSTPLPYSYLGYSVLIIKSKTRDFNDRSYIFVASAPRASNGLGEIRFYIKRFVSTNNFGYDTLQSIFQLNNTNHSIPFILTGEQIGSYFGHTMTAGDLNGDGYTDLVVSAPFYYSKKPSHGGAVYIYYGLNGKYSNDRRQVLFESPIHSRFGFAIACIPDLNKDGIDDLAISAPGEKDDIHTGSVYIYLGSRTSQLTKYTQKIVPSQLLINSKQTTIINDFGFSLATQSPFKSSILSSSIVSSNSTILIYYPSLIIGIPKADMIVHLKSHPLVNVNVRIENMKELQSIRYSAENRRCKTIDGTPVVCFDVRLCFESNDKLAQNLIIIYTLTADALSTIRRILSTVNHLPTITNKQILNTCENQTFITKSGNDDFLTPIHFSLVYNISQDRNDLRGKPFILEGNIPMINATDEERTKKFQANFYKGCGNDDKCITDLQLAAEFINGQKTLNLSVLGIDSEIRIRLNLSNVPSEPSRRKADPAFGTKIDVYFPTSFVQFSQAIMDDKSYSCQPIHRNHVRCKMTDFFNNPFPPEKYSITELVFTLSNVSLSNILRFEFNSTTLTDEKNLDNNNVTLVAKVLLKTDLNLRAGHEPEQVSVSGEGTLGLSSIKNLDQFGMEVTHIYTIINSGPNNVRSHNVTILWPYETLDNEWENGKILLYLVEEPIIEISSTLTSTGTKIDGQCERLSKWRDHIHILDSLNRTSSNTRQRRNEQNVEGTSDSKASVAVTTITPTTSSSLIRSLTLTCDPNSPTVRCYPIYCHINGLSAQSYYFIKLRARLWNSTLIENYFDGYDRVDIQSFASIHINDLLVFQTSTDNDNATATTPAEFANRSDKIIVPRLPLWVPLVGAMAGLILLVFIVIVCCLLGFFQRTKAPPLKKKSTALTLDGTTTNSSSDEHQRILLRQTYRQPMLIPSSTTNSFNDENYHSQQTTIPLIHSIPEVPSADNHDQDIDEDEEDDELIQNNLGNQSDIDEEARFPVEDDDDEYSSKMNERLVDTESINHSLK
ncbi:unnamed protein product [Rotaria magnacalcarata]|uniref:Uncharacterized protein n=2 Tax=Rotaria magnacalcarata TaxID=392030 RepID=A0A816VDZ7_9BILA|nr:unnamed protein product [Rotaria magnacalcarata]CAF2248987.1 unnamed protein product [Rotaria magnacalcarata]